ncbi:hypothetical protein QR680_014822 [Steinernema hermaphroditum]|uniref:Uncharacterized protein n=1 Tax=Steinernema hermaphroditum TaxID=289476 RepID=A0AA39M4X7_9BILA|nr:hypothetical protein QR680_014822 [Steinernema hermaphroditum]
MRGITQHGPLLQLSGRRTRINTEDIPTATLLCIASAINTTCTEERKKYPTLAWFLCSDEYAPSSPPSCKP